MADPEADRFRRLTAADVAGIGSPNQRLTSPDFAMGTGGQEMLSPRPLMPASMPSAAPLEASALGQLQQFAADDPQPQAPPSEGEQLEAPGGYDPASDSVRSKYNLGAEIERNAAEGKFLQAGQQVATSAASGMANNIYQQAMRSGGPAPGSVGRYRQAKSQVEQLKEKLNENTNERKMLVGAAADVEASKAETDAAGAEAIGSQMRIAQEEEAEATTEATQETDAKMAEIDGTMSELKEMKIDPKRAFSHMGNGEKAFWRVAMVLEGAFAGAQGKEGELAAHVVSIIDRDIAMQEKEFGQKRALLGEQKDMFGLVRNKLSSEAARRDKAAAIQIGVVKQEAEAKVAKYDAPAAKARGQQLISELDRAQTERELAAKVSEANHALKQMRPKTANLKLALQAAQLIGSQAETARKAALEQAVGPKESETDKRQRIQVEKFGGAAEAPMEALNSINNLIELIGKSGDPGTINRLMAGGITERIFVSDDASQTMRNIQQMQNKMLSDLSGAAVSETEFKRFEKSMDDPYLSAEGRRRLLTDMAKKQEAAIRRAAARFGGGGTREKYKENLESVDKEMVGTPRSMER